MKRKPLVVITTYNREELFWKVYNSIDQDKAVVRVILDGGGTEYSDKFHELEKIDTVQTNEGIGRIKKRAVGYAVENQYKHLFLVEDDVLIEDNEVWKFCMDFRKKTGLLHFNWNTCAENTIKLVYIEDMSKLSNNNIDIHENVQGAFSYFDTDVFTKHGVEFDVNFKNAYEHVDVEYQMIRKKLLPSFWNFASPSGICSYLKCIDEGKSTITGQAEYEKNLREATEYWQKKWGNIPNKQFIPDRGLERTKLRLDWLQNEYGVKLKKEKKLKPKPVSIIACIKDRCHFRYTKNEDLMNHEIKTMANHDEIILKVYKAQQGMGGIIPNQILLHNSEGFRPFDHFLKTLKEQSDSFDGEVELIIVDYESVDDDVEDLIQLYWGKDYQYIPISRERKFSRGYALHQGIQKAKYDNLHITDIDMTYWTPRPLREASDLKTGQAIFPQIFKEQSPSSLFLFAETAGFGIASFTKGDYETTNGFIDKSSWGAEDHELWLEFVEALGAGNIKRTPYRDMVHQWHTTKFSR